MLSLSSYQKTFQRLKFTLINFNMKLEEQKLKLISVSYFNFFLQ